MLRPVVLCCAGHSCEHELETARINGVLGNMDANTGEGGRTAADRGGDAKREGVSRHLSSLCVLPCGHQTMLCMHAQTLLLLPLRPLCALVPARAGDAQTGWDTDQFLSDPREATLLMGVLIKNGGLGTGGINFDAKLR